MKSDLPFCLPISIIAGSRCIRDGQKDGGLVWASPIWITRKAAK